MRLKLPSALSFEEHPRRTFLLVSSALVIILYWRSFSSPFLYDDLDQIVKNSSLESWRAFTQHFLLRPVSLTTSFSGQGGSIYRPLFWLSLFIDRSVWEVAAGGFHATNVALHLLNGNLAFALLRRLSLPVRSAAAISLLWLSLPINTEVVAWVSGRAYALCTLFLLLCLLCALNYLRGGGSRWASLSFVTAACALLSHELGIVILPLTLLLVLTPKPQGSRRLLEMLGVLCLALTGVEALRFAVGVKTFSGLASPRWAGLMVWNYSALTLLPVYMSMERSTSVSLSQPHRWLPVQIACLALVFGYALLRRRTNPALLGCLAWFVVCIAPFSLFVSYQGVAERFAYLASLGLAGVPILLCSPSAQPRLRHSLLLATAVWSMWNITRTLVRVKDWSDPVRLYRSSLQATPQSPLLHFNLAYSLREQGDLQGALREYERTLQINRSYPHGFAGLGDVYLQLHAYTAAQAAYRQALAQDPHDTAVLLNSGTAFQSAGSFSEAKIAYDRVLQLDPASSAAHVNLGVLYLSANQSQDAMHQFAMAIDLKTRDPVPYYDLAVILQQAGRSDLALVLYKKVLELRPNDEDTLRNIRSMQQAR